MHLKTLFFFLVWCAAVFYTAHSAHASGVYTIRDVTVSKKADDANKARQLAIDEAQNIAFHKLMRTLVSPEDFKAATNTDNDTITKLVQSFDVDGERILDNSYKATFNFTFGAESVQSYLNQREILYTENVSPTLLVLPIFQEGERIVLWESPNPWREAWTAASAKSIAVPFIVALGDLQDISTVSVEDAFAGDYTVLQTLGQKYNTERMVIAEIIVEKSPVTSEYSANVILRVLQKGEIVDRKKAYFQQLKGTPETFMPQVVKEVLVKLESNWRQNQREEAVKQAVEAVDRVLNVTIPIGNMQDWLLIKSQLDKTENILRLEVNELNIRTVEATLIYKGELNAFQYALEQKGLLLQEAGDGHFLLTHKTR